MSAEAPLTGRFLIIFFASCIVAIASQQILVKYLPKRTAKNPISKEELLSEFQSDIDIAKAAVSPEYLEKYNRKAEDSSSGGSGGKDSHSSRLDLSGLKRLLKRIAP